MKLLNIKLTNWRNYESLDLDLDEKVNEIIGNNGSGKTNLVEAIHYLSNCRSWRSSTSDVLIKKGEKKAYIVGKVKTGDLTKEISLEVSKGSKKISINGNLAKRVSELSKLVNVLLFTSKDVALFTTSPFARRSFLDETICKKNETYLDDLRSYNNLLNERNTLLKDERIDF